MGIKCFQAHEVSATVNKIHCVNYFIERALFASFLTLSINYGVL